MTPKYPLRTDHPMEVGCFKLPIQQNAENNFIAEFHPSMTEILQRFLIFRWRFWTFLEWIRNFGSMYFGSMQEILRFNTTCCLQLGMVSACTGAQRGWAWSLLIETVACCGVWNFGIAMISSCWQTSLVARLCEFGSITRVNSVIVFWWDVGYWGCLSSVRRKNYSIPCTLN